MMDMAKADRLARLDVRRAELETEYRTALIAALRTTASGKWGLFDHNGNSRAREAFAPLVNNLNELGDSIDDARDQLQMPAYDVHRQFIASRGPVEPQAVGEPKQAQAWLDRLEAAPG
jgi:hypothetical protein